MKKITLSMLVIVAATIFMVSGVATATTNAILVNDNFNDNDFEWGTRWISNDYNTYSHFSSVIDSQNTSNRYVSIEYGNADSNAAPTITFISGVMNGSTMIPNRFNTNESDGYFKASFNILRIDQYCDEFTFYAIYDTQSFFYITKPSFSDSITVYYKDTNGNTVSNTLNTNLEIGKWGTIEIERTEKNTIEVTVDTGTTQTHMAYNDVAYDDNVVYWFAFQKTTDNAGGNIYIDNALLTTQVESPPAPEEPAIPQNPLSDISSQPIYAVIFIALIAMISVFFFIKKWFSTIIIGMLSFILFSMFIMPFFGVEGTTNIIISGIVAINLSILKYYTIKDEISGMFSQRDINTLLITGGILILMMLLFWSF